MIENTHNWTINELITLYDLPLLSLITQANRVHTKNHDIQEIQISSLISIKTGGCPEDCKYCSQSVHYKTGTPATPLMKYEEVLACAKKAIEFGATRICLGVAWREVRDGAMFDQILEMVRGITALGAEVCCTLGMLNERQATRLKDAGIYAYSHNLDTSENYYASIITTRTYHDRLDTLDIVEKIGISVCCGGILGMGETIQDRLELLLTLSKRNPQPDSVPINRWSPVVGSPLMGQPQPTIWEMVRIVAIARIVMPKAIVRLSAGRDSMSFEQQALCFLAGANSIHIGEILLTVTNPPVDKDREMLQLFGIKARPAYVKGGNPHAST